MIADLKKIYQAATVAEAEEALEVSLKFGVTNIRRL